ncbi:phage tail protein [Kosakonia oryzendophytica]|uniref:phage tail-collar fiber domain-containing protein n=1 Tax=Kosakonia oryzendophytica TaxID=1005665 RepID=UPI003D35872A
MTTKYFAILTNQGAAKLTNATALGRQLKLTQMAVGDANGALPTPDAAQTALINQKRIAPLNTLTLDPGNASQIIAEQVIPETEGGFWIREIGLYDDEGTLVAVANCPETYKPQMQEGSGRTQIVRMLLAVSSPSSVTLTIDPAVVLATRKYVDDKVIEVKAYADGLLANHLAAANPHPQYVKVADIAYYTPIGVPVPYPAAVPPGGWMLCNGATFDKAAWPGLAAVYPSGVLPDLRGEFIRGWDNARGVDSARVLLTAQGDAIRNLTGSIPCVAPFGFEQHVSGAFYGMGMTNGGGSSATQDSGYAIGLNASLAVPTAAENRPRNIAFNYIVRAA